MTRFAHAVREELWSHGHLVESRLEHGEAFHDDGAIVATNRGDPAFVAQCEEELERLRSALPRDALVRLVAEAGTAGVSSAMTVRLGSRSIVTDPAHLERDLLLLRRSVTLAPGAPPRCELPLPLLWRHGSAAVLLHECAGHPLEHGQDPIPLPDWLDADIPLRERRATFRDVPLQRMVHVRVSQTEAPFDVPADVVEVHLVDGGAYEPLTQEVTIRVGAAMRMGIALEPFVVTVPRTAIRFLGAKGEPVRYPGVVCSREGQELLVESWAPLLMTELG